MATSDVSARSTFTCIWTIENFSYLTYIDVRSPLFVVKSMGDTVWHLHINEYAGFSCCIESDIFSDGIDFEFSFLGADGSPLISQKSSEPRLFLLDLLSREEFLERLAELIPNNTLTVQCRMWKRELEVSSDVCYARTRLNTYTGTFTWAIDGFSSLPSSAAEDFSTLALNERRVYPLKPLTPKGPFMALIMYLKKNSKSEEICIEFLIEKPRDYAYSCKISVLDMNGKVIATQVDRGRTDYSDYTFFDFCSLISKNKLISNRKLFLPNNTLVLSCSFEVCAGVISNELEYFTPNVSSVTKEEEEFLDFDVIEAEANTELKFEEYFLHE